MVRPLQAAHADAREGRRRLCRPGRELVKINVDEDKFIAAQFRVQSIPTVYAMFQGQPVADLTSARTEGQLTGALDQILAQLPIEGEAQQLEAEIEPLIAMGEQVLAEGDAERAVSIFRQIVEMAPDNPEAIAGLARALIAAGRDGGGAGARSTPLPGKGREGSGDRPRPLGAGAGRDRARPARRRRWKRGSRRIPTIIRRATTWPAR